MVCIRCAGHVAIPFWQKRQRGDVGEAVRGRLSRELSACGHWGSCHGSRGQANPNQMIWRHSRVTVANLHQITFIAVYCQLLMLIDILQTFGKYRCYRCIRFLPVPGGALWERLQAAAPLPGTGRLDPHGPTPIN